MFVKSSIIDFDREALICAAFGFCLYTNAIWICGFCYDDRVAIVENPDVLNSKGKEAASSFLSIFQRDFWGTPVTDETSHKSYRPLTILSFRFDVGVAQLLGVPGAAWVFHLFNALLYALTCWMVVKFILSPVATAHKNSQLPLLLSGLWFASHPVHVESVTGLVGRADILAAVFCMLGTKLHANGRALECAFSLIAACLCKETSVVIPVMLATFDMVKINTSRNGKDALRPKSNVPAVGSLVAVSLGYVVFRSWLFGSSQTLAANQLFPLTSNFLLNLGPLDKLRTAIWVQVKYMLLLVLPVTLSCDYGLGVVNPVRKWMSFEMLQGIILIFLVILWGLYGLRRLRQIGDASPLLALGWTFAPLVPTSHIVGIGTVMAERLLFLPSIGGAILLCHFMAMGRKRSYLTYLLLATIPLFSHLVVTRNLDWRDSSSLFEADLESFPQSLKMLRTCIVSLDLDDKTAVRYAERAQAILDENSDIFPADAIEEVRSELFLVLADKMTNSSNGEAAIEFANYAIKGWGGNDVAMNVKVNAKKGRALLKVGVENDDVEKLKGAVKAYRKATQVGKVVDEEYWFDIHEGKGQSCYEMWRITRDQAILKEAVDAFRIMLSLGDVFRDNDERWSDNLVASGKALFAFGTTSGDLGVIRESASVFQKAIEVGNVSTNSQWAVLHQLYGKALLKLGPATRDFTMVKKAAVLFKKSIEYDGSDSRIHVYCMLATAYAMLDQRMKAYEQFRECFHREETRWDERDPETIYDDRLGYRVNYAVLMQKLSGVATKDTTAIRRYGRPAIAAIDSMLEMSREQLDVSALPQEQLQRWAIVKNAIKEQIELVGDQQEL